LSDMEEFDPNEYLWDLHLGTCANKYFSITYPACQNRLEYHNKLYYKYHYYYGEFSWLKEDKVWKFYLSKILLGTMIRTDTMIDPKTTYMWYSNYGGIR